MEQTFNPQASLLHLQMMRQKVQQAKKADGTYQKVEGLSELKTLEIPKSKKVKAVKNSRDFDA